MFCLLNIVLYGQCARARAITDDGRYAEKAHETVDRRAAEFFFQTNIVCRHRAADPLCVHHNGFYYDLHDMGMKKTLIWRPTRRSSHENPNYKPPSRSRGRFYTYY